MICDNCCEPFEKKPRAGPRTRFCTTSCRQIAWLREKYRTDPVYREWKCARVRDHYDRMDGVGRSLKQLRSRRSHALRRKSLRASRLREA